MSIKDGKSSEFNPIGPRPLSEEPTVEEKMAQPYSEQLHAKLVEKVSGKDVKFTEEDIRQLRVLAHNQEDIFIDVTIDKSTKETNPKDEIGSKKAPITTVPLNVMLEVGVAMLEGSCKYGRHNYRNAGVRASVYLDAVIGRHLAGFWEGEDLDPDSQLSHVTKAIAGLVVLRDAMLNENWFDDRPIKVKNKNWVQDLNEKAKAILAKYPHPKAPFLAKPFKDPR